MAASVRLLMTLALHWKKRHSPRLQHRPQQQLPHQ
jgi:hypothetical protein